MQSKSPSRQVLDIVAVAILAMSLIYLLKRSVFERSPDIDFRYIWTAGKLWAKGIDPYSSRFLNVGRIIFTTGNAIDNWLYPPQWWIIARTLAIMPIDRAVAIWRGLNAALLVAAAAALVLTVRRVRPATPRWTVPLAIAAVALMEGTAQTLLMGQTSLLVFAGFCLVGCALLISRRWVMVVALLLLLLKPQFAVPVLVCLACMTRWRGAVLIAIALTGLASLPQVIQFGLAPTIRGMLGNMALHGELRGNWPENLSGFAHLVWKATGLNLANDSDIALDLIVSAVLALTICRRRDVGPLEQGAMLGIAFIAAAMFFLPVHDYDMIALAPVALLGLFVARIPRYLTWCAVALAFRPGVICAQFGDRHSGDLLVLSAAGLLALIAAIGAARGPARTIEPVSPENFASRLAPE